MKTFGAYLKDYRGNFLIAVILSIAVGLGVFLKTFDEVYTLTLFASFTIFNFAIWYALAALAMGKEWMQMRHRYDWECSMLNALKLANESDIYYKDQTDTNSAFHELAIFRTMEGVRYGYLNSDSITSKTTK